jgi:hypothetical protein
VLDDGTLESTGDLVWRLFEPEVTRAGKTKAKP